MPLKIGDMVVATSQKIHSKTQRRDPGFSLIELLVVMGILAMLAGLVAPKVVGYLDRAKVQTAASQIEGLRSSLDLYLLDVGKYPSPESGLEALVTNEAGNAAWNGPYLRDVTVPVDPWGNAYVYALAADGRPSITSLGADAQPGGEGDAADIAR